MAPHKSEVKIELTLIVVDIESPVFGSIQSVAVASKSSTSTTWKTHVIGIVGTSETHKAQSVLGVHSHQAFRVTVMITITAIKIKHIALVHARLDSEIENCGFLAIIDTGDASKVTLLIIRTYFIYYRRRKIL